MALKKHYKEVNPTIGKTIRQYFDLRNDKMISELPPLAFDHQDILKNAIEMYNR